MSDNTETTTTNTEDNIEEFIFNEPLHTMVNGLFLQYAEYVIKSRALTRWTDGLKPIQRRILYMSKVLGLTSGASRKKSSSLVGQTMAFYHPHGNDSIYGTAVNMEQDFGMRYPLIDGMGNFGSIDGDGAAAMRYTEIRLSKFGEALVKDTNQDVTPYIPNYDETTTEPLELTSMFCNSLLNGSKGVAVGVASNLLPHYAADVYKAIDKIMQDMIDGVNTSHSDVISIVKAPDFPMGGIIINPSEVAQAYKTGRGSVKVRAHHIIENNSNGKHNIVFTDVPYQENKATLVEEIGNYAIKDTSSGISDVRDESDRNGIRIVVECSKGANLDVVLANLFKRTKLQTSISLNNTMLDDNNKLVENVSLLTMLKAFVCHVLSYKQKEYNAKYKKLSERYNILAGLILARENIDRVIEIIREADDIILDLMNSELHFNKGQAEAIASMRLSSINKINIDKYKDEYEKILADINHIKQIFSSRNNFISEVKNQFKEFASSPIFSKDARRTEIVEAEEGINIEDRDLILSQDIVVTYSHLGLLKAVLTDEYNTASRTSKGNAANTKDEDFIEKIMSATTKDDLLILTNTGKCYTIPLYKIPIVSKKSQGKYISNYIELEEGETIVNILSVSLEDMDKSLLMLTRNGIIKKLSLDLLSNRRYTRVISFREGDSMADACIVNKGSMVLLATASGKGLKINIDDIRPTGKLSYGVRGINIKDSFAINVIPLEQDTEIVAIGSKGIGKRFNSSQVNVHGRGTAGVLIYRVGERSGDLINIAPVKDENDTLFIMTANNVIKRINISSISLNGLSSSGSKVISLNENDSVKSFSTAPASKDEEDKTTEE